MNTFWRQRPDVPQVAQVLADSALSGNLDTRQHSELQGLLDSLGEAATLLERYAPQLGVRRTGDGGRIVHELAANPHVVLAMLYSNSKETMMQRGTPLDSILSPGFAGGLFATDGFERS